MFDSLATSEDNGVPFKDALHIGKVVMNDDPEKLQRIKITIPGFMDGEDIGSLPWLGPIHPSGFGMSAEYGVVRVPMVGSLVVAKFQNGDIHHGLYIGYVPTSNFAKSLPEKLTNNYPNRVGYIDPMGTIVYTDVSTGEMSIWHCSGSQFTIEPTGPLLRIVSHMDITGNINLKGNITMEGNTTQTGNIDLTGTETVSVDVIANGISLVNHTHSGVRGGPDNTGKPR